MKSMTNNYVKTNNAKAHSTPHNELNHWFRIWGIIGERREPVTPVRTAPFFDKGPGAQLSGR